MNNDEFLVVVKDMFEASMDKMEKKFNEKVEEINRHTGMLFEDLRKDVKLLAEGHSILTDKIDRLETKVDRLETKVDRLDTEMSIVKGYVIGVDTKLNEHELILKRVRI
ncbi:MAG: hypothetical protein PHV32_13765 [Eubacteriales bacterium]|nr:hypothetical protein [Eubacteriales bacterium]